MTMHPLRRLRSAGLAAGTAALLALGVAGVPSASAAGSPVKAKKSCHTSSAKIVKRKGSGVLFTRNKNNGSKAEGTVYYACSTKYGKRVRLAADASQLVDESFEIVGTKLSGRSATFEYCKTFDTGKECHRVKADLKSGKSTETTTVDETDPGAGDDGPGDVPDDSGPVRAPSR